MKTTVYEKSKTGFAKVKRFAAPLAVGATVAMSSVVPVFAEGESTAETAIVSGMSSAASSMTNLVGKAVPIVIPILTAVLVVKFGMKLFKSLTGKAS